MRRNHKQSTLRSKLSPTISITTSPNTSAYRSNLKTNIMSQTMLNLSDEASNANTNTKSNSRRKKLVSKIMRSRPTTASVTKRRIAQKMTPIAQRMEIVRPNRLLKYTKEQFYKKYLNDKSNSPEIVSQAFNVTTNINSKLTDDIKILVNSPRISIDSQKLKRAQFENALREAIKSDRNI